MNGFVSATSVDLGKVLDVAMMSKNCQMCTVKEDHSRDTCTKNFDGSSGAMEVAGAQQLFQNSINHNVRYLNYLGDGDSRGFLKVVEGKPYGDSVQIKKLSASVMYKSGWLRG